MRYNLCFTPYSWRLFHCGKFPAYNGPVFLGDGSWKARIWMAHSTTMLDMTTARTRCAPLHNWRLAKMKYKSRSASDDLKDTSYRVSAALSGKTLSCKGLLDSSLLIYMATETCDLHTWSNSSSEESVSFCTWNFNIKCPTLYFSTHNLETKGTIFLLDSQIWNSLNFPMN